MDKIPIMVKGGKVVHIGKSKMQGIMITGACRMGMSVCAANRVYHLHKAGYKIKWVNEE